MRVYVRNRVESLEVPLPNVANLRPQIRIHLNTQRQVFQSGTWNLGGEHTHEFTWCIITSYCNANVFDFVLIFKAPGGDFQISAPTLINICLNIPDKWASYGQVAQNLRRSLLVRLVYTRKNVWNVCVRDHGRLAQGHSIAFSAALTTSKKYSGRKAM